ncbi:hypothetical protein CSB20_08455 [bacterium DOLZORAL124_64_63]|nr:MAG: hypothetical protein CSB20_08455 [bacterium DOLZORAL124_64_63]
MFASRHILFLAQGLLIVGALGMIPASIQLFRRAVGAGLPPWVVGVIVPVAMLAGYMKAVKVMRKRMRANIARLRAHTGKLWPWQLYPPQLLVFIIAMVVLMRVLKRVLDGQAAGLATLGGIDVAVAVALLVASGEYRRRAD